MIGSLKSVRHSYDLNKKKLFLTGGNGLVGRNIQEHPRSAKWTIFAPTKKELDLIDASAVSNWIEKNKPHMVIHAAGLVGGIKANLENPVRFLEENVTMGRNVLMASRNNHVKNFINLGSTCMYPHSIDAPLTEDLILTGELEPTNEGYALAKLFTTKLCQYIHQENSDMEYKTLIPCNLYGRYDDFDPETSHLVAAIIKKIYTAKINNLKVIDVWGDGAARREFLYAGDLADAILLAAENLGPLPNLMNIGFGSDYSINEYYELAASVIDWKGKLQHNLDMPVGMRQKLSGLSLQRKWGWTAKMSLRQGMQQTYQYFLENHC
jgi:GDP-L-fucose synthase